MAKGVKQEVSSYINNSHEASLLDKWGVQTSLHWWVESEQKHKTWPEQTPWRWRPHQEIEHPEASLKSYAWLIGSTATANRCIYLCWLILWDVGQMEGGNPELCICLAENCPWSLQTVCWFRGTGHEWVFLDFDFLTSWHWLLSFASACVIYKSKCASADMSFLPFLLWSLLLLFAWFIQLSNSANITIRRLVLRWYLLRWMTGIGCSRLCFSSSCAAVGIGSVLLWLLLMTLALKLMVVLRLSMQTSSKIKRAKERSKWF